MGNSGFSIAEIQNELTTYFACERYPVPRTRKAKSSRLQGLPEASHEHLRVWQLKSAQLEELLKNGLRPPAESINGWAFRGLNVGIGARLIGIQKFIKAFYVRQYGYGSVTTGHNIVVKQNRPEEEYHKVQRKGAPKTQGVYMVEAENENWSKYPNAALLHYGRGDNPWYEPAKLLRDYLVQPYSDNPDLLLGKAYFALGPLRLFGGYFVLERLEQV